MKGSTERLHDDDPDHFTVEDGKGFGTGPGFARQGSGSSGGPHVGTLQEDQTFKSNEKGFDAEGVGAMPYKTVGSMAPDSYGADLGPDATNTLEKFDADSDSLDVRRLLPRNASEIL